MLWNVASHKDPSWVQDFSPFNDLPDQIKEGELICMQTTQHYST